MAAITVDVSQMPRSIREALLKNLADENAAKLAVAKVNQARLAKLYREAVAPGTTRPVIGPMDLVMDPYFVSYFSRTCEARERVWDDPEFRRWLRKNGPNDPEWFSVPHAPTKIQVGYRGN